MTLARHGLNGQGGKIVFRVQGYLAAVHVQRLPEIAVAVQQAHGYQRDVLVTGRFKVITGQNSQSAGVDGKTFVQAVFRGKMRNGPGGVDQRTLLARGGKGQFARRNGHVGVEIGHDLFIAVQVGLACGQCGQCITVRLFDHAHGVVSAFVPRFGIEIPEQGYGLRMPAPPQVIGQFAQAGQGRGEFGHSGQPAQKGRGG